MLGPVSVLGVGSYLPEKVVGLDFFFDGPVPDDPMLHSPVIGPPPTRRHVDGERAAELIERAAVPLMDRLGVSHDVDVLITNVLVPDDLYTGCGAEVAMRLGCSPEWMIDLHNTGCASFAYMLKLASTIIGSGQARTALLANVQNAAGQVYAQPGIRLQPNALAPGDGCGVAYVAAGERSPILGVATRNTPGVAMDLEVGVPGRPRKYWEAGDGEVDVVFDATKTQATLELGNRVVPEVVRELCEKIEVKVDDIDVLITNQPNRIFLRNWRDALGLPKERHVDTYDTLGNLYGAGMPVTLDHAVRAGRVRPGDLVVVAGFAHAGDFTAAAAIRWGN